MLCGFGVLFWMMWFRDEQAYKERKRIPDLEIRYRVKEREEERG